MSVDMEQFTQKTDSKITISDIAKKVHGELFGPEIVFKGIFNTLGHSKSGDIVIRHWIDPEGIKIASKKEVAGIITQDPRDNAIEFAVKYGIPLIVVEKIEIANAFALNWTIKKFAPQSHRVVVTGTNGKSTTSHMIFHILQTAGWNVYTNTDSKSEFNSLIDPMVAKQISEYALKLSKSSKKPANSGLIDAMVLEVSEVQGWLDKVMNDHALIMTNAINPEIAVITNVALDHIGLINSLEESYEEILGSVKSIKSGFVVLNTNDSLVKKMGSYIDGDVSPFYHGPSCKLEFIENSYKEMNSVGLDIVSGIYFNKKLLIAMEKLPFKSKHFIENTLSAISACICLDIPLDQIIKGVKSYNALKRRFSVINEYPTIIDDFAHNPDGIKATIKSAAVTAKGKLWVVCSIRGSRGDEINIINSKSIADSLTELKSDYGLIISSSSDVVDNLNVVEDHEKKVFLETLTKYQIEYIFEQELKNALKKALEIADDNDTILLIGAQGMDPASDLICELI
jgi:UDP-N-acetylmuramoyl-L-alanyl-D-glutamate--2,6-diaminopimelate ligase